jgi:release factor glutamine methyltransferase
VTLATWCSEAKRRLDVASLQCHDTALHARQIASAALNLSTVKIIENWNEPVALQGLTSLENILLRRLSGEPFQYILGKESFWESEFLVGPGALIPRRETEHLVEEALKFFNQPLRVIELGAGSGNIGISCLLERPNWEWTSYEINPASVLFARKNAGRLLPKQAKYKVVDADFFTASGGPYDLVVSNPPYVSRGELASLSKEVKCEPKLALDGGKEGWEIYERYVPFAWSLLHEGGTCLTEIGSDQGKIVPEIFQKNKFQSVEVVQDFAGLARVVKGVKGGFAHH